jgi:hypothetical protein
LLFEPPVAALADFTFTAIGRMQVAERLALLFIARTFGAGPDGHGPARVAALANPSVLTSFRMPEWQRLIDFVSGWAQRADAPDTRQRTMTATADFPFPWFWMSASKRLRYLFLRRAKGTDAPLGLQTLETSGANPSLLASLRVPIR